jgi:hypothetical protein
MRSIAVPLTILATMLATFLGPASPRSEVVVRFNETWVSGLGNDSDPCTRTQPCKTFARAIAQTSPGGRIGVLDSGNFGEIEIVKAISIMNDGAGEARVTIARADSAVRVFAGAGDRVFLHGLTIDGGFGGAFGILFGSGAALHVQNSVIRNFDVRGIDFQPTGSSELYVSDTLIAGNGSSVQGTPGRLGAGITIRPSEEVSVFTSRTLGSAKVVLDRVQIENNGHGIEVDGGFTRAGRIEVLSGPPGMVPPPGVHVIVRESVVAGNSGNGINAVSTSLTADMGTATSITIDHSSVVNNQLGVGVDGARATLRLSDSTVAGNETGLSSTNLGHLDYSKNNSISGNDVNITEPPSGL